MECLSRLHGSTSGLNTAPRVFYLGENPDTTANARRCIGPERGKLSRSLRRRAPPNALGKLPFPASAVNTSAV